jgi:hypothetical protein
VYYNEFTETFEYRIGFFADLVTEETISMAGSTEFRVETKNCIVYLLENTGSSTEISVFVSADRSTEISFPKEGAVQYFRITAKDSYLQCYVELKFPGGVTIPKLSFYYSGDTSDDVLLFDHKDSYQWQTPMKITEFYLDVMDSRPHVYLNSPHEVATLKARGVF